MTKPAYWIPAFVGMTGWYAGMTCNFNPVIWVNASMLNSRSIKGFLFLKPVSYASLSYQTHSDRSLANKMMPEPGQPVPKLLK